MVHVTRPRRGGKRKRTNRLGEEVFRDTSDTEGGLVKGRGEVLRTACDARGGRLPNINCRVQSFGRIVSNFGHQKRQWVQEIGMGSLMYLRGKNLPRGLCYWLLTKVDPEQEVFISSPGHEHPLSNAQVKWVLGIPSGNKEVPREVVGNEMKVFVDAFHKKYGVPMTVGKDNLSISRIMDVVEGECADADESDFKIAFLALALGDVLCPTTCMKFPKELVPSLFVARQAFEYDWCGLVYDWFLSCARRFCQKFYKLGYANGCGGCSYFLAIYYLDRLDRRPIRWDEYPRIKAWEESDVNDAKNADKLDDQASCSDYDKLGFLTVAYGERHPNGSRDTMGPQSLAIDVANLVLSGLGIASTTFNRDGPEKHTFEEGGPSRKRQRRKGPNDETSIHERTVAKRAREASNRDGASGGDVNDLGDGEPIIRPTHSSSNRSLSKGKQKSTRAESSQVVNKSVEKASYNEFADREARDSTSIESWNSSDWLEVLNKFPLSPSAVGLCTGRKRSSTNVRGEGQASGDKGDKDDESLEKSDCEANKEGDDGDDKKYKAKREKKNCQSRCRRGLRSNLKFCNKEYEVDMGPRRNPMLKAQIVKYVRVAGSKAELDNLMDTPHLIKCGSMFADLRDCYTVVGENSAGVRNTYISMVAVLYTEMWKNKYGKNSSIRLMMDPSFGMMALQEDGPSETWHNTLRRCKGYAKKYPATSALRYQVVFIPVLQDAHWWCVAVSVNTSKLWVMDSLKRRPLESRRFSIDKLCMASDLYLKTVDSDWEEGKVITWERKAVMDEPQDDGFSCGIRMLLCIKTCVDHCRINFRLTSSVEKARGWLLAEDVLADENEVRDEVKKLLK